MKRYNFPNFMQWFFLHIFYLITGCRNKYLKFYKFTFFADYLGRFHGFSKNVLNVIRFVSLMFKREKYFFFSRRAKWFNKENLCCSFITWNYGLCKPHFQINCAAKYLDAISFEDLLKMHIAIIIWRFYFRRNIHIFYISVIKKYGMSIHSSKENLTRKRKTI